MQPFKTIITVMFDYSTQLVPHSRNFFFVYPKIEIPGIIRPPPYRCNTAKDITGSWVYHFNWKSLTVQWLVGVHIFRSSLSIEPSVHILYVWPNIQDIWINCTIFRRGQSGTRIKWITHIIDPYTELVLLPSLPSGFLNMQILGKLNPQIHEFLWTF